VTQTESNLVDVHNREFFLLADTVQVVGDSWDGSGRLRFVKVLQTTHQTRCVDKAPLILYIS